MSEKQTNLTRRDILKLMGLGTAVVSIPGLISCQSNSSIKLPENFYNLPMKGKARILHITDVHGQLNPVYFREPNVNLGVGAAFGRPPHVVGNKLLTYMNIKPGTAESYAYTYLDFQ